MSLFFFLQTFRAGNSIWNCAAQFHHFTDGPGWLSSFQPQVFWHAWNASNGCRLLLHVLAESLNVKIHLFKETFSDFLVWEGSLSFPYHVPNWFSSLHLHDMLCTSLFISCSTVKFRKAKLVREPAIPQCPEPSKVPGPVWALDIRAGSRTFIFRIFFFGHTHISTHTSLIWISNIFTNMSWSCHYC